jgi:hypothetical protein
MSKEWNTGDPQRDLLFRVGVILRQYEALLAHHRHKYPAGRDMENQVTALVEEMDLKAEEERLSKVGKATVERLREQHNMHYPRRSEVYFHDGNLLTWAHASSMAEGKYCARKDAPSVSVYTYGLDRTLQFVCVVSDLREG